MAQVSQIRRGHILRDKNDTLPNFKGNISVSQM